MPIISTGEATPLKQYHNEITAHTINNSYQYISMLIMHVSISDKMSVIHNSNNAIKRGSNPKSMHMELSRNHIHKGTKPKGNIPTGTKPMGTKPMIILPQR